MCIIDTLTLMAVYTLSLITDFNNGRLFVFARANLIIMNLKRTFGLILTILGIIGLIYAAYGFVQNSEGTKELIVFAILGMIFFFTGIGLVRNTTDQAK